MREIGLDLEGIVTKRYSLKDSFKADELYQTGYVFTNERILKNRADVHELLPSVRDKIYDVAISEKALQYDLVLVPADSFGCPGYFRMAYCIDTEKVERSLPVLRKMMKEIYG